MKFLVTKDLAHSSLLANLMSAVVFVLLFYLGLDVVLHGYVIGFDIPALQSTLYGNAENFEEPMLIDALLLQVHIDLFMTLFAVLILSSVYIRLFPKNKRTKKVVHAVFISGMTAPPALLLAYFTNMFFAYIWLVSFAVWHLSAALMGLRILKKLLLK